MRLGVYSFWPARWQVARRNEAELRDETLRRVCIPHLRRASSDENGEAFLVIINCTIGHYRTLRMMQVRQQGMLALQKNGHRKRVRRRESLGVIFPPGKRRLGSIVARPRMVAARFCVVRKDLDYSASRESLPTAPSFGKQSPRRWNRTNVRLADCTTK